QNLLQGLIHLPFRHFGEKAEVAEIDADHRNIEAAGPIGHVQQGAVAAEDDEHIHPRFDDVEFRLYSPSGQPVGQFSADPQYPGGIEFGDNANRADGHCPSSLDLSAAASTAVMIA